jgi:hypothetical protein
MEEKNNDKRAQRSQRGVAATKDWETTANRSSKEEALAQEDPFVDRKSLAKKQESELPQDTPFPRLCWEKNVLLQRTASALLIVGGWQNPTTSPANGTPWRGNPFGSFGLGLSCHLEATKHQRTYSPQAPAMLRKLACSFSVVSSAGNIDSIRNS